jgi:hypothetical protein
MSAENQFHFPGNQDATSMTGDNQSFFVPTEGQFYFSGSQVGISLGDDSKSIFDLQHGIFGDAGTASLASIWSAVDDSGNTHASAFHALDLSVDATAPSIPGDALHGSTADSASSGGYGGADSLTTQTDHVPIDHASGLNIIDNPTDGLTNSTVGDAFSTPSGHSFDVPAVYPVFDVPAAYPVDLPDVFSAAKGGSHGGGGGGGGHGGATPAPYTTDSGTGVDFHVAYDSSVGNAPAGFTSVVQQVADFFASSFQNSTPITINIDVGYGEVDGMRMGRGAIGESATNLQDVSYSDLTSAYSTSGLSLGSSVPTGNLFVSYAEAKALDITITNPQTVDGYVGFSSQSGIFDYHNADGVSSNQYDFYGTVAHEFSEVMGRILLVGSNINSAPSYMAYDFFHFSSPGVQDFSGDGGYFSNDQGTTNLAYFNNPTANHGGDAGDWADTGTSGSGGSAYDAFNAFGTTGEVTPVSHTDLLALNAVGFDLHPAIV